MASGREIARMPTPTHPPYALMIGTAIQSLAEEGGSTEPSISEYIKSNFDGLPWGHDKLLPYYLQKLTSQGEFVTGLSGRYLVADQDEEQQDERRRRQSRGNSGEEVLEPLQALTPLSPLESEDVGLENDTGLHIKGGGPMGSNETTGMLKSSRRSVRQAENTSRKEDFEAVQVGPDDGTGDGLSLVLSDPMGLNESVIKPIGDEIRTMDNSAMGWKEALGQDPSTAPKRRGRPPKRKQETLDQHRDDLSLALAELVVRPKNAQIVGQGPESLPKRRGRPPKNNSVDEIKFKSPVGLKEAVSQVSASETKRRGRPPKNKSSPASQVELKLVATPTDKTGNVSSSAAPKRRGRPPKPKPDAADS